MPLRADRLAKIEPPGRRRARRGPRDHAERRRTRQPPQPLRVLRRPRAATDHRDGRRERHRLAGRPGRLVGQARRPPGPLPGLAGRTTQSCGTSSKSAYADWQRLGGPARDRFGITIAPGPAGALAGPPGQPAPLAAVTGAGQVTHRRRSFRAQLIRCAARTAASRCATRATSPPSRATPGHAAATLKIPTAAQSSTTDVRVIRSTNCANPMPVATAARTPTPPARRPATAATAPAPPSTHRTRPASPAAGAVPAPVPAPAPAG